MSFWSLCTDVNVFLCVHLCYLNSFLRAYLCVCVPICLFIVCKYVRSAYVVVSVCLLLCVFLRQTVYVCLCYMYVCVCVCICV